MLLTATFAVVLAADGGVTLDAYFRDTERAAVAAHLSCSKQLASAGAVETSDAAAAQKHANEAINTGAPARDELDALLVVSRGQFDAKQIACLSELKRQLFDCVQAADLLVVRLARSGWRKVGTAAAHDAARAQFDEYLMRYPDHPSAGQVKSWREELKQK